jgi:hypothetical protein
MFRESGNSVESAYYSSLLQQYMNKWSNLQQAFPYDADIYLHIMTNQYHAITTS